VVRSSWFDPKNNFMVRTSKTELQTSKFRYLLPFNGGSSVRAYFKTISVGYSRKSSKPIPLLSFTTRQLSINGKRDCTISSHRHFNSFYYSTFYTTIFYCQGVSTISFNYLSHSFCGYRISLPPEGQYPWKLT